MPTSSSLPTALHLDRFLYGVCYYPEHWASSPSDTSRIASDIQRIAKAGFHYIRIGEGAWSYFEPTEGHFQFDLFDKTIALAKKHNIQIIFGTPTYCAPAWVARNYPETLRQNFNRIPMQHGSRRNFNYTSPKYLELAGNICTALAEHYKKEKAIFAWQLDNEFNCHMDVSYAPSDETAFAAWLKNKYGTIAKLNAAWGTAFWSQTYNSFDQVRLPHPTPTYQNPTHLLDEARFISDTVCAFSRRQAAILRKANPKWLITHNGLFGNVNGPDLATNAGLDFFSHDQYPLFSKNADWPGYSQNLMMSRSLSFPYAVLEQQSGPGGQLEYLQPTPRNGQIRLWAWQSIAHGAKMLSFFRWRTCPYGAEQHWHGILDQDDQDNRRLAEVTLLGKEIAALPKHLWDSPPARAVAVMKDFDNETNDYRINTYTKTGRGEHGRWLAEFAKRQVPVDLVWPSSDLKGYKLLVLPHLKIVDKALVEKITAFANAGGTVILGAQSGLKDKNAHITETLRPGLWRKPAGVEIEDWTVIDHMGGSPTGTTIPAKLAGPDGRTLQFITFAERLKPARGTETLATWQTDDSLLAGSPAITRAKLGKGSITYIGGYCTTESIEVLADEFLDSTQIAPLIDATPAIEALARIAPSGKRYLFLLNHTSKPEQVRALPEKSKDLLTNSKIPNATLTLPPYGVAILEH